MKCTTKLCKAEVKQIGGWQSDKYCKYIEAICPVCEMTYWVVRRANKIFIVDRKLGEDFDHRKNRSN